MLSFTYYSDSIILISRCISFEKLNNQYEVIADANKKTIELFKRGII